MEGETENKQKKMDDEKAESKQTESESININFSRRHSGGWNGACALRLCLSLFHTNKTEVPLNNLY